MTPQLAEPEVNRSAEPNRPELRREAVAGETNKPTSFEKQLRRDTTAAAEFINLRRLKISDAERENLERLVREQVADSGFEKRVVTFDEIQEQARRIDPKLVHELKKPPNGATLRPEVRLAARERLNLLNDLALQTSTRLREDQTLKVD